VGSPIVLDLTGNGVSTASISQGVQFDVFGINQQVNTGWVSGGDGLLVLDRNHDGSINGGAELFGQGTDLSSGQKASNGYQALAELDSNHDGVMTTADAGFDELMVWVDQDADGISASGELHSLTSLGITQLDLHAASSTAMDNGNLLGLVSSYSTADGATHDMADVWFQTHLETPKAAAAPPAVAASLAATGTLGAQVAGMVEAMGAFNAPQPSVDAAAPPDAGARASTSLAAANLAVDSSPVPALVDAMRGFDANGQSTRVIAAAQASAVAIQVDVALSSQRDAGVLASSR